MKELAPIMIHARKIFNYRVSFKMLLSMYLTIVEKELWILLRSSNFQNGTVKKITTTVAKVALIQVSFLKVGSKQKTKNKHTEYHGIFIPFKCQVYAKHGSTTFILFGSWGLVLYLHVSVKAKFYLVTITYKLSWHSTLAWKR